jgi:hypothetical protein
MLFSRGMGLIREKYATDLIFLKTLTRPRFIPRGRGESDVQRKSLIAFRSDVVHLRFFNWRLLDSFFVGGCWTRKVLGIKAAFL